MRARFGRQTDLDPTTALIHKHMHMRTEAIVTQNWEDRGHSALCLPQSKCWKRTAPENILWVHFTHSAHEFTRDSLGRKHENSGTLKLGRTQKPSHLAPFPDVFIITVILLMKSPRTWALRLRAQGHPAAKLFKTLSFMSSSIPWCLKVVKIIFWAMECPRIKDAPVPCYYR